MSPRSLRLPLVLGLVLASAPGALVRPAQEGTQEPPEAPSLELRVNRCIARGVAYLASRQAPDGTFPGHADVHPGGITALSALTLVEAGVRRDDPVLARALKALEGQEMASVYSASVHLLLCEALGVDRAPLDAARRSLTFLVECQDAQGVWAYPWDHLCGSNTQFALLGLRAARRLGLELPEETVGRAAEGLWHFQDRSGGFVYTEGGLPYDGMTAAALAGIAVLEEIGADSGRVRGALKKHAKDRAAAEAWIEEHFDPSYNRYDTGAWTPFWSYAYMWAVERWCGLTGTERVAGRDWYAEGAARLVETQADDGSWTTDDKPLENTCFALLFLRKATVSGGDELAEIYARIDDQLQDRAPYDRRPGPEAQRIVEWLLAGPWQGERDHRSIVDLPFTPSKVSPRLGGRLARKKWERVELLPDRWTNLDELTKNDGDHRLWALATTLTWKPVAEDLPPVDVVLWLDLEDGWDVYLDGERVGFERRVGSAINGDVRIPLHLEAGDHLLLALVSDDGGAAAFGARVTDAEGRRPPVDLTWSAVPGKTKR